MKTMGLRHLYLVNPTGFPGAEATARAAGADDVLYHARVVSDLSDALKDCVLACATTARRREIGGVPRAPRGLAAELLSAAAKGPVALVFGRESSGLNNAEVLQCQLTLEIPANPAYSSLNLASAVQVVGYELRTAVLAGVSGDPDSGEELAGVGELEGLYAHFEAAATALGFHDPEHPKKLMARVRALFGKSRLTHSEVQILRGLLSAGERRAGDLERIQATLTDSPAGGAEQPPG